MGNISEKIRSLGRFSGDSRGLPPSKDDEDGASLSMWAILSLDGDKISWPSVDLVYGDSLGAGGQGLDAWSSVV